MTALTVLLLVGKPAPETPNGYARTLPTAIALGCLDARAWFGDSLSSTPRTQRYRCRAERESPCPTRPTSLCPSAFEPLQAPEDWKDSSPAISLTVYGVGTASASGAAGGFASSLCIVSPVKPRKAETSGFTRFKKQYGT